MREVFLGAPEGFSLVLKRKPFASRYRTTGNFPSALVPVFLKGMGVVSTSTQAATPAGMGRSDDLVEWTPQGLSARVLGSLTW